jgi:hypothetical protein
MYYTQRCPITVADFHVKLWATALNKYQINNPVKKRHSKVPGAFSPSHAITGRFYSLYKNLFLDSMQDKGSVKGSLRVPCGLVSYYKI